MNVWSARVPAGVAVAVLVAAAVLASCFGNASAQSPGPSHTPIPLPSGTPWPAPTGLKLTVTGRLLDENNVPLPPEKQVHTAELEWPLAGGFTGSYEVEHASRNIGTGTAAALTFTPAGEAPIPAGATVDGVMRFSERIDFFKVNCYRVRTVINGETGPYSDAVCTVEPPTSGGGATTPAPLPPDAGDSLHGGARPEWIPAIASLIALLFGFGAIAVPRLRSR